MEGFPKIPTNLLISNGVRGRNRTTGTAIFSRMLTYIFQWLSSIAAVNISFVAKGLRRNCQHDFGGFATTWCLAS